MKLHSKKSRYSDQGSFWRKQLYEPLCGNSMTVLRTLALLRNGEVGIVGPGRFFLSHDNFWGVNRDALSRILKSAGVDVPADGPELGFFAGTMFWFVPDALMAIQRMPGTAVAFEAEAGKQDGTLAHAWERAFCLLARAADTGLHPWGCPVGMCLRRITRATGFPTAGRGRDRSGAHPAHTPDAASRMPQRQRSRMVDHGVGRGRSGSSLPPASGRTDRGLPRLESRREAPQGAKRFRRERHVVRREKCCAAVGVVMRVDEVQDRLAGRRKGVVAQRVAHVAADQPVRDGPRAVHLPAR